MAEHCCEHMRYYAEYTCDLHPDRFDCAECHIHFDEHEGTYGLIELNEVGGGVILIDYCPWCGGKLPKRAADVGNVVRFRPREP